MTFYLISFPSGAMQLDDGGLEQAGIDSHQVIRDAKAAGVYVFGGGINEEVPPVRVAADGVIHDEAGAEFLAAWALEHAG